MRNWACARKARNFSLFISHFSFLMCHFLNFLISHFSFLICHFLNFLISHFSFVISHFYNFLISHLFLRERERDPCIDAQQDDEQGLDGVDDQHEEQGIV